jgi:hypothetical protein
MKGPGQRLIIIAYEWNNSRAIMIQLPFQTSLQELGWHVSVRTAGNSNFFQSSAWGCATHFEASDLVPEHLKCMDVFSTRSEVQFINIQCSELLITIKKSVIASINKNKLNSVVSEQRNESLSS